MFSDLIDALKAISENVAAIRKAKHEKIEGIYKTVVEDSYQVLQVIHKDYSINLSTLRDHLINQSIPPQELIQWLRRTGLEYRDKREHLQTIATVLIRFSTEPVDVGKDKRSKLYRRIQEYVDQVVFYVEGTIGPNNLSFYRYYEDALLNTLTAASQAEHIGDRERAQILAQLFYKDEVTRRVHVQLLQVVDDALPRRWKGVSERYRLARAAFQDL